METNNTTQLIDASDIRHSLHSFEADEHCFVCGKDLTAKKKWFVDTVAGIYVMDRTPSEAEIAKWDSEGSYTGLQPVGATCARYARAEGAKVLTAKQAKL